jgi:choline kinase
MSSRFGGKPKQIERVGPNNETLIEYSINQSLSINPSKIVFVTNKNTENLFKQIFKDLYKGIKVEYVVQYYEQYRKRPWGTLDAICCCNPDQNFIVINGDDIYGKDTYKKGFSIVNSNKNAIGLVKVIKTLPKTGTVNRGIVNTNKETVTNLKEMLNISYQDANYLRDSLANVNFLCFQSEIINIFKRYVSDFKEKHKGDEKIEILLPDILNIMIGKKELELHYFEINNEIMGITNPQDSSNLKDKLKNNYLF